MLFYCSKLVNVSCKKCKFIFETIRSWQRRGNLPFFGRSRAKEFLASGVSWPLTRRLWPRTLLEALPQTPII